MGYKNRRIREAFLTFFNENQLTQLFLNGSDQFQRRDHFPVVCLEFKPLGYRWLITEIDPLNPDKAFGLMQTKNSIQIGTIDLHELDTLRGEVFDEFNDNLHELTNEELEQYVVSQNYNFKGEFPLSVYHGVAIQSGKISFKKQDCLAELIKYRLN